MREKDSKSTGDLIIFGDNLHNAYDVARLNGDIPYGMSFGEFQRRSERNWEIPKWDPYWSPFPGHNATMIPTRLLSKRLRRSVQKQRNGK